ncbi:glycosyltransferase [Winogradskyella maritima]|uniref:Glycosyltransferase family 2 protein n=1 Tax=Winogradskyella maritima TaxID=1517766 RepID=A0ABV8AHP6_9FLAO|nr:glycosyltransferase [Winogradskyella maritima]
MPIVPKVSILLPVYNGEKTIEETVKSLLNQSFKDFEIIVGIDGSSDNSKNIVQSFKDSRIRIIEHSINLGLANNLNALVSKAHPETQYFAMAEQDDVYVSERLQWQVEYLDDNVSFGLVSGIAELKSENGSVFFPGLLVNNKKFPPGIELFKYLYINQLKVVNTCMLWRKAIHIKYNLKFRDTYGNFNVDWNFILRFSLISDIHGLNKILVRMKRLRSLNSVTTDKKTQHNASRRLLLDFKNEFEIINNDIYSEALKTHRKIELGHKSKLGIFIYGIAYFVRYTDPYFIKYIYHRLRKYFK